jgi:hypothetical protein
MADSNPEGWLFKNRSAATLERVVPISQKREVEGKFVAALASIEFYGEAGCVVRYLIDIYSLELSEFSGFGTEGFGNEFAWSDMNHVFVVRDQSGREYDTSPEGSGASGDEDGTEYREGNFAVEPLAPGAAEVTVELREIIRETCYESDPELATTGDEETVVERLWEGPLSFTFAI